MANVYEKMTKFYAQEMPDALSPIQQNNLDKFFRRLAWQGKNENELQKDWEIVRETVFLMYKTGRTWPFDLDLEDIWEIVYRATVDHKVPLTEGNFVRVFEILTSFFLFLVTPLDQDYIKEFLDKAKRDFYFEDKFSPPERPFPELFDRGLGAPESMTDEEVDGLNDVMDDLMDSMRGYYSQNYFSGDVLRATMLFLNNNPEEMNNISREENNDAWYGFWDYFLFDYHLLEDDMTPIRHFYLHNKNVLNETERGIIGDLLRVKFTVFFIEGYVDDCVMCRDLFTDETIELPTPEIPILDYKQVLFCGHLRTRGVMLLNYVSLYTASPRLRKRIKSEVIRQYDLFRLQKPMAKPGEFFYRHAAAVRHTLNILCSYARLNVVSNQPPPKRIEPPPNVKISYERTVLRLRYLAKNLGLSANALNLLGKLYEDFVYCSDMTEIKKRRIETLLAMIYVYATLNFGETNFLVPHLTAFGVKMKTLLARAEEIRNILNLKSFDPRYAAEEGFVISLYAFLDVKNP